MKTKLTIECIKKSYIDKEVLKGISFTVNKGEFLSILGPSGCGKTTLMYILTGLLEANAGTIFKDNEDITYNSPNTRGMGIVFQDYALFPDMTVLKNVEYALKINKNTRSTARQKALDLLERVELCEHLNKKPRELSGGQQQRVAIARTLVLNPEIILFDEPMSALDVDTRLQLRIVIKNLQKEFNSTMIYITHDQEEAFAMSDRIMVMNNGEIMQIDTPEEIIENPSSLFIEDFVVKNLQLKIDSLRKYMG